jgi:hypothetical protein
MVVKIGNANYWTKITATEIGMTAFYNLDMQSTNIINVNEIYAYAYALNIGGGGYDYVFADGGAIGYTATTLYINPYASIYNTVAIGAMGFGATSNLEVSGITYAWGGIMDYGDIEDQEPGGGLILTSPNGLRRYKITISNLGVLVITPL